MSEASLASVPVVPVLVLILLLGAFLGVGYFGYVSNAKGNQVAMVEVAFHKPNREGSTASIRGLTVKDSQFKLLGGYDGSTDAPDGPHKLTLEIWKVFMEGSVVKNLQGEKITSMNHEVSDRLAKGTDGGVWTFELPPAPITTAHHETLSIDCYVDGVRVGREVFTYSIGEWHNW